MRSFFKRYFIPHPGNDHKPHFLRPRNVAWLAGGVLVLELLFLLNWYVVVPRTDFFAAILPGVLVDFANQERIEAKLNSLAPNSLLERAAKAKAEDMAAKGYFAHTSPEGRTPWAWISEAGYEFVYAGENLAVNFTDSKDVNDAWMNSLGHRANILSGKFTEIGIATAQGIYKGREAVFVVQMFGRPLPQTVASKPAPPAPRVDTKPAPQPTFAAVEGAETIEEPSAPQTVAQQSSLVEKTVSAPRSILQYIYFALALVVLLALVLKVVIQIRIQHPALILSGVFLFVLVGQVILTNEGLVKSLSVIF